MSKGYLRLADDLACAVDHTDAAGFHRHINRGNILHSRPSSMPGVDPFGPRPHHDCEGQPAGRKHSAADAAPLRQLKLCGAGEWLAEKYGTRKRRSWKKLHLGVDADTG